MKQALRKFVSYITHRDHTRGNGKVVLVYAGECEGEGERRMDVRKRSYTRQLIKQSDSRETSTVHRRGK